MQAFKSLLMALAAMSVLNVAAQTAVGVRGGMRFATVTELQGGLGSNFDPGAITGLQLAVYAQLPVGSVFAIQPELNFLQKGSSIKGLGIDDAGDVRVVVDYLEMPVLAKVGLGAKPLQVYLIAGPSVGYALGGRGSLTLDGTKINERIVFDNNIDDDGVKDQRWDVSAIFGGGASAPVGPGRLVMDIRYGMDFTDFQKFKDGAPAGYDKAYNRGLGLSLGYQFKLGL